MAGVLIDYLDRLDRLASEATPGKRSAKFLFGSPDLPMEIEADGNTICEVNENCVRPTPNFRFIAALDPETVKALVAVVREAQRALNVGTMTHLGTALAQLGRVAKGDGG